jgi:shikimate dehydrogenase
MEIYCIIGDRRVASSLSPLIHNSVFAERSAESLYVPFSVEEGELKGAVQGIRSLGIGGANVTVPHKETVIPFLDGLSEEARAVGAVNTIVRDGKSLIGHNTDVGGFGDLLEFSGFSTEGSDVLLLGAGGAAHAVLRSLIDHGAGNVSVANRTYEKSVEITGKLGGIPIPIEQAKDALLKANLLVNTTSVFDESEANYFSGLAPKRRQRLDNLGLVIDINYGHEKTFWAKVAEKNNAEFMDGLFMLVAQARRSFQLWTGEDVTIAEFLRPLDFSDEL